MSLLIYEKTEHYAVFTLNRPEVLNAFNEELRTAFLEAMDDFNRDSAMRVGIVTGSGRAFCVGGDLKEMTAKQTEDPDWRPINTNGEFGRSRHPFIAAVNGPAVAGGFEWTLDCDIRICTPETYFGQWEVKRGMAPAFGIQRLSRYLPFGEAMMMVLTGRTLSAEEALRWGFVHEIVPNADLLPRAIEIAKEIAALPPVAVEAGRALARQYLTAGENPGMAEWVGRAVRSSRDYVEGPRAFAEKRQAEWSDPAQDG